MMKGHEGNSWGSLERDVGYIQDSLQNLQGPVQDENVRLLIPKLLILLAIAEP